MDAFYKIILCGILLVFIKVIYICDRVNTIKGGNLGNKFTLLMILMGIGFGILYYI